MKKFYFAAIAAVAALGANAQYNVENVYMNATVTEGNQIYDIFVADQGSIDGLKAAGKTVNDYRVDEVTRFFYIWDGTFNAGDSSYPGIGFSDMQFEGYTAIEVASVGWSGAGYNVNQGAGIDVSHWNDNTRLHIGYMSPGTAPESIGLIINNQDGKGTTANVSLGSAFNDNGKIFPIIGTVAADDWKAVDISFGDLKKVAPGFNYEATNAWTGNIVSLLAGGVTGRTVSLDAIYCYTPAADDAVEGIAADANLVVTANTINSNVAGIAVYDLEGRLVKSADATILGIADLNAGAYIAKSGAKAVKFVK